MVAISATRALPLFFAACTVFAQQPATQALPDAPSIHSVQTTGKVSLGAASAVSPLREPLVWHFDPGHFNDHTMRQRPGTYPSEDVLLVKASSRYRPSDSNNLFARAISAASGILIARGGDGSSHLNNQYLLKVLTSAAAQTAERPYWRRSPSQPFADIGSMIGNDAGMNVLHEFQPGILQLVKNHQPRFVLKIAGSLQGAVNGPVESRTPNWNRR